MKKLLLILVCGWLHVAIAQKRDKSFDAYWPAFRNAVLHNDLKGLDSLTLYPVIVRGTMDWDPKKNVSKKNILKALKKFMPIDGGLGEGTHQQEIEKWETIPLKAYENNAAGNMRVGDMQFKKVKGKWKFYFMYLDDWEVF